MSKNDVVHTIPGPDAAAVAKSARVRLVPRVYAERPTTTFRALAYRLKKAILSENVDLIKSAASAMTSEERYAALEQFGDDIVKGTWNRATHRFDGPESGVWSVAHPRPAQDAGGSGMPAEQKRQGPELAPQTTTGFRHAVTVGAIFHADIDGTRHHFKALKWGPRGVTGVNADGDVAAVAWPDVRWGVHVEQAIEHAQLVAKAATMRKSAGLPDDALYAMSPSDRAQYLQERDR
jgi:hypothetical protein